jgi:hypothetical protein
MEDIDIIYAETYHRIDPGVPCAVLKCQNIAYAVKLTPIGLTELGQTEGLSGEYIAFPLCASCAKAMQEKYGDKGEKHD